MLHLHWSLLSMTGVGQNADLLYPFSSDTLHLFVLTKTQYNYVVLIVLGSWMSEYLTCVG